MRKTTIDKLCDAINLARRVSYPMPGYLFFADVRGDGQRVRRVYTITGATGGITACHNGQTYKHTAQNLREVLSVQNIF